MCSCIAYRKGIRTDSSSTTECICVLDCDTTLHSPLHPNTSQQLNQSAEISALPAHTHTAPVPDGVLADILAALPLCRKPYLIDIEVIALVKLGVNLTVA